MRVAAIDDRELLGCYTCTITIRFHDFYVLEALRTSLVLRLSVYTSSFFVLICFASVMDSSVWWFDLATLVVDF